MYVAVFGYVNDHQNQVAGPFETIEEAERFRSTMYDIDSSGLVIGDIDIVPICNPLIAIEGLREDVGEDEEEEDEEDY